MHTRPNPYNHDIYHDNHYVKPHRKLNSSTYVEEPEKVAEIRDSHNNLRYKVILRSRPEYLDELTNVTYSIIVINCYIDENETVILRLPRENEPKIRTYDYANAQYQDCIDKYRLLVQAETSDIYDMTLYSHKTGYKMTTPECCETCDWCKVHRSHNEYIVGVTGKLECHNPINVEKYDFNRDHLHDYNHSHRTYCHAYDPRHHAKDIYPIVEPFGKCDNYKSRREKLRPVPGENLTDILEYRMNKKIECEIKPIVDAESTRAMSVETILSDAIENIQNSTVSAIMSVDQKLDSLEMNLTLKLDNVESTLHTEIQNECENLQQTITQTKTDILDQFSTSNAELNNHINTLDTELQSVISSANETDNNVQILSSSMVQLTSQVDKNSEDISECLSNINNLENMLTTCSVELTTLISDISVNIVETVPQQVIDELSDKIEFIVNNNVSTILSNNISTIVIPNISAIIQEQVLHHMPIIDGNRDDSMSQLLGIPYEIIMMSEGA